MNSALISNSSKKLAYILGLTLISTKIFAQNADSILNVMTAGDPKSQKTIATFKGTRVVFSQSTETQKAHNLNFIIRHNFGDIGGIYGGSHTLYGLDVAYDLFIGFDYGINNRLQVGFGRSRENETYDLNFKYKLVEQEDHGGRPFTIDLFAQAAINTARPYSSFDTARLQTFYGRTSYFYQVILARKFNDRLSLQLMPSYLYQVHPINNSDHSRIYSLGIAGRLKVTKRLALVADYQLVNSSFLGRVNQNLLNTIYYNPLGIGIEIETGGHVFSLHFMNTEYILENNFIPNTQKSWRSGGVRLGFSIARVFTLFHTQKEGITDKSSIR